MLMQAARMEAALIHFNVAPAQKRQATTRPPWAMMLKRLG